MLSYQLCMTHFWQFSSPAFRYVVENKGLYAQIDKTSQQSSFKSCAQEPCFVVCVHEVRVQWNTGNVECRNIHKNSQFWSGFPGVSHFYWSHKYFNTWKNFKQVFVTEEAKANRMCSLEETDYVYTNYTQRARLYGNHQMLSIDKFQTKNPNIFEKCVHQMFSKSENWRRSF